MVGMAAGKRYWGRMLVVMAFATLAICAPSASAAIEPSEVQAYRKAFDVPLAVAQDGLAVQAKGTGADIVGEIEGGLGEDFAGVWFDPDSGEFVVPISSGGANASIGKEMAAARLTGDYRTQVVQHSWEELQDAQEEINAGLLDLIESDLVQTALDPRGNAVVIYTAERMTSATHAQLDGLVKDQAVAVELRERADERFKMKPYQCQNFQWCGSPMRGGVGIYPPEYTSGSWCTSAFRARDANGKPYVLTAGHCVVEPTYWPWATKDDTWTQRSIGTLEQWQFPGKGDWAKINATGSWADTATWPEQVVNWGVNQSYPIYGESSSYMNQIVCHTGVTTGSSCGKVTDLDMSVNYGSAGWVDGLTEIRGDNYCNWPGDSGGPYFAGNMALGIHSGGPAGSPPLCGNGTWGVYSEISDATKDLGVRIVSPPPAEPEPEPESEPEPVLSEDTNSPGPHVVAQPDGSVDAFYRTPSGGLGHSWTEGAGWSEEPIWGAALHPTSVPHPVTQTDGTIDVFWKTPSNGLGHAWNNSFGWHVETLPGELASEPHAAAQPNGTIDVFHKTPSGGLGHNWYQHGGKWQYTTRAGSVASDPYPVVQANGAVDVFYRTPSGTLGHSWTQGGVWSQQPISGTSLAPNADPHPVHGTTVDVFWRKPDSGLGHAWVDGGGWHANTLSGALAGEPHPVAQPSGVVDVFWRGYFGELGHNWYVPGSAWASNTLTSGLTSEPSAVAQPSGAVDVFWRKASDTIGHAWYVKGGSWSVDTLGGTTDPAAVPQPAAQPDGTVDLFYRTPAGGLGHNWFEPANPWKSNTVAGSLAPPPATGLFKPSTQWTTWPTTHSIQFADVNGDGREDIVGRNSSGEVQVGLSTGTGFAASTKWTTLSTAYVLHLADVNGDGKADIVGRNPANGDRLVGLSTGSGFAAASSWGVWSAVGDHTFMLGDANGDGKADSIGRHVTGGQIRVGLSTGSTFSASTQWNAGHDVAYAIEPADTTGDGKVDLGGRNTSNGDMRVGLSSGSAFNFYHQGTWSNNFSLQFADVDGDNRADQVGRGSSTAEVWVGISTPGKFLSPAPWSAWSSTYSADFADVDGDGREDLVGRNSSGKVHVGLSAAG